MALADPSYPLQQVLDTTFHEAFHALEDRILTDQEMEVLKREDARLREIVQKAYGFSNEEIKSIAGFEIRAMAFEYYASMRARLARARRPHRQGNKLLDKYGSDNFEVEILAYVTERTVDAKMWDLNATKLKMINGIRKYDGAFTMEFEDEDSVGMTEIAAPSPPATRFCWSGLN
ncbi:hypothetical protein [Bradyrhizobium australiense]|uniref:Uncharacterized protein n=1 Tax=Bradyrhizobium australiense TaxID=2721161 RepID=A0A7Y4GX15_9BRAD|nr:hypothetical protein [Bradyrhizobium australiense]NOJ43524.1 hypothetical protein [Bradyrhizobium australiense]